MVCKEGGGSHGMVREDLPLDGVSDLFSCASHVDERCEICCRFECVEMYELVVWRMEGDSCPTRGVKK